MIDIESRVYDPIAKAIRAAFPGADVSGEYVRAPKAFPHVYLAEADNYASLAHLDSAEDERFSTVMYEVSVYSNKTGGRKSECRNILSLIDGMLYDMNFTRISMAAVPNLDDATIYRLTARYRAETDGETIYRI